MVESQHSVHVTPLKVYLIIAVSLFVLTGITVAVSKVHLGPWNAIVALAIASVKGLLVALFFMHLLYDKKIYALIVGTAIVILAIFIGLTMADVLRRGDIYEIQASPINPHAKIYKQNPSTLPSATHGNAAADTANSPDSILHLKPDSTNIEHKANQVPGGSGH